MASGCHEAGYRLAGAPLDHVCCRHLYGSDRMLTAWPAPDRVVILAVGPHDRSAADVYALLLDALAVEVPVEERSKPPWCDELGEPPADGDLAEAAGGGRVSASSTTAEPTVDPHRAARASEKPHIVTFSSGHRG